MAGRLRLFAALLPDYARIAWWGLVSPRVSEQRDLVVFQAVIRGPEGVLLAVRRNLRGWELPGGNAQPGETPEEALRREVEEETGLAVTVERRVGDYRRSGFRPHLARVYLCRVAGGVLRPSWETPVVAWFAPDGLPHTLFPWFRGPLRDALHGDGDPVERRDHQGLRWIREALWIDLRMRSSGDRTGLRRRG